MMRNKHAMDSVVQIFKKSIKCHSRQAQLTGMTPSEFALQLAAPDVDMDFIYNWEDAEREIACSWLRLLERQAQ